jgi:putative membrane protein
MYYLARGDMMDGWNGYNSSYGAWGWLLMLLMMALFILAVVLAVRYLGREWHGNAKGETALDVLKKRYAKGEIGKEEYEEAKKDITSK